MKLSDYVIKFIADLGVKHIFMLPGGGAMHLNDSVGRCPDIEYVCTLHEQAAAIAAEAYARVTNNIGVAIVTTGPGGTNAITGVAGAWLDSTPCLFISGQVKRPDLKGHSGCRQVGNQEIDIVTLVQSITKYAITVIDPHDIRRHLEKAIYLAKSGRPGPVWIDLPLDVQAADINSDKLEGFRKSKSHPDLPDRKTLNDQASKTLEVLEAADRPVILGGNGIRLAGAMNVFRQLAEKLNIPVLTTRLGVDLLPASSPLNSGMPGSIATRGANFILQNSDLLVSLGAGLDLSLVAYSYENLARAAKKIVVNIDPCELRKIKTPVHLPVCADVRMFMESLIDLTDGKSLKDRSWWVDRCRNWKAKYPFVLPEHRAQKNPLSVYYFSEILSEQLSSNDVILPGSSGFASEIFLTAFKVKEGQRVFHNKGTGAMGFGQPAAIGACLGSEGKRTICIDGDGGFLFNVQELVTIRRLQLPIKIFVVNNQGYASIRASQQHYFGRLTGADSSSGLMLPDVISIAEAFGLTSFRISNAAGLEAKITNVLEAPGPVVCDVMVIPDEIRAPRVASTQRPDGSMVSKPLEDMWPLLDREEFRKNMIIPPVAE